MTGSRIDLMGCPVDALTMEETLQRVDAIIQDRRPRQHMALNSAKFYKMGHDADLRRAVRESDLINADGMGIVWASRILGMPLPARVPGVDLMQEIVRLCAEKGYKPFFFGARQEVVERVVARYREMYPALTIAGFHNGYFKTEEQESIALAIRDSGADVLFVAISSPVKETFQARWKDTMNVPFIMGVGGSFDVVAGRTKLAPPLVRRAGLEWLWRAAQEPRRLLRRTLVENNAFALRVVQARIGKYRLPEP